jgi:CDP-diglyceride synthetase
LGIAVFIAAGLREFYGLARRTGAVVVAPTGYALAAILLFLSPGARLLADGLGGIENAGPVRAWVIGILEAGANRWEIAVTLTIVAPLVSLLFKRQASRDRLTGWTVTVVGAWYVTWLLGRVGSLRLLESPDDRYAGGAGWVMLMVLGTWACDTGSYLVGSRFGRRKMVPWISPGKTWEGALGGAIATVMVVAASTAGMPEAALGFEWLRWRPLPIPWEHVVPLGVGIAIAAMLGDCSPGMEEFSTASTLSFLPRRSRTTTPRCCSVRLPDGLLDGERSIERPCARGALGRLRYLGGNDGRSRWAGDTCPCAARAVLGVTDARATHPGRNHRKHRKRWAPGD